MNIVDAEDELGRGKLKIINNKIHLEFHDEYEHINASLEYITENNLAFPQKKSKSYDNLEQLYNSAYSIYCKCVTSDNCIYSSLCLHGGNYTVTINKNNKKELILNKSRSIQDLIYECSKLCHCLPICQNRLVQFGPRNNLKIIDVSHIHKQYGLASTEPIPEGGFICEYVGEILTKEMAETRHVQNKIGNCMNYIICLNEYSMEAKECGKGGCNKNMQHLQTFVDPSQKGNIGRYLNHSCDPNCELLSVRIDGPIPKIGIFAKKDIPALEELCFDYGENSDKNIFDQNVEVNVQDRKLCYCGSNICRKYLPNLCF